MKMMHKKGEEDYPLYYDEAIYDATQYVVVEVPDVEEEPAPAKRTRKARAEPPPQADYTIGGPVPVAPEPPKAAPVLPAESDFDFEPDP